MEKVFLIDFDDSFTLNIYCELLHHFSANQIKIIAKRNIICELNILFQRVDKIIIILGPGPGHPREYDLVLKLMPKIIKKENIFLMGICLGHQLIWSALGAKILSSQSPAHGRVEKIILDEKWSTLLKGKKEISVQRYNSLAVKIAATKISKQIHVLYSNSDELMMSFSTRFISYQFHPESVGTSCPKVFFGPMAKFLL